MAQVNITLNQEEILQLFKEDTREAFRRLITKGLNSILKAESQEQLKAEPYERTLERTDSRNGTRDRELKTSIGTITLRVPRHRNQPFKTMIFENYCRSDAALIAGMAEMVVNGVSTRKVSRIMETLCGTSYSKSAVSELCKELDKGVEEFRNRPLTGEYPFLTVDAAYFSVRENNRTVKKPLMIAYGSNEQGYREVLGFQVFSSESAKTWEDFLHGLKKRGLTGLLMVTSDAHGGIIQAVGKVYPEVPWQRCQFHFSKNILDDTPKKYQAGLGSELQEMFNARTLEDARKKRNSIIADYKDVAEKAMECLDDGFESSMTVMALPRGIQRYYRTSNHIERLNRELKRRSKVIGVFPNETSLVRLMGSVLIELNENRQTGRKIYSEKSYKALLNDRLKNKLKLIAAEQQRSFAA